MVVVRWGCYLTPVQFLDHLTVIIILVIFIGVDSTHIIVVHLPNLKRGDSFEEG